MNQLKFPENIKAEIAIDLIQSINPFIDYLVDYSGKFTRNYENDIINLKEFLNSLQVPDVNKRTSVSKISRDGFYHSLPEALFHDCNRFSKNRKLNETGFQKEYKKQQEEIINAKKFFLPFENILFNYRVKIEKIVNHSLYSQFSILKSHFISHSSVNDKMKTFLKRLCMLLPLASSIKGDEFKTTFALQFLLNTPVTIKKTIRKKLFSFAKIGLKNHLGTARLADNFICGNKLYEEAYIWYISIVFNKHQLYDYFKNHNINSLLNKYFINFFLPKDIDVVYLIKSNEFLNFKLGKTINYNNRYLGYNIKL